MLEGTKQRLPLQLAPSKPVQLSAAPLNDGGIHVDAHLDEVHILAIPSGAAHSGGHLRRSMK